MSQFSEDPLVLHIQSLISEGEITCARDLTECLDTMGATPAMREVIVAAGIYSIFGQIFARRLQNSLARCRAAIENGAVTSPGEYDSFLRNEGARLEPNAAMSGYKTLRIESRQTGLYDYFHSEEDSNSASEPASSLCIA